jgi:hypothetical protein
MRILKTRARLGYKHAFVLLPDTETRPSCVALLEKKSLTVGVNSRLLDRCSGPELVFHLADALFRAGCRRRDTWNFFCGMMRRFTLKTVSK